jgi:t-SNARE complex subunit (syntaxin)
MPFGVVAIVFAAQVDGKYAAGDYHGAVDSANKAKTWCWVSFGIGLVGWIAYAILQVVVFSAVQSNQYYY